MEEEAMEHEARLRQLVGRLGPRAADGMPEREAAIVRAAMAGKSLDAIRAECAVGEEAVWQALDRAAGAAPDITDKAPRPSQAEGEEPGSGDRPSGARRGMDEAPRPSQAEGELEDIEEALRRKEQGA
jgi:hypothetical protein